LHYCKFIQTFRCVVIKENWRLWASRHKHIFISPNGNVFNSFFHLWHQLNSWMFIQICFQCKDIVKKKVISTSDTFLPFWDYQNKYDTHDSALSFSKIKHLNVENQRNKSKQMNNNDHIIVIILLFTFLKIHKILIYEIFLFQVLSSKNYKPDIKENSSYMSSSCLCFWGTEMIFLRLE
jgi:hypothetical protein